jgi:hypothetical protein
MFTLQASIAHAETLLLESSVDEVVAQVIAAAGKFPIGHAAHTILLDTVAHLVDLKEAGATGTPKAEPKPLASGCPNGTFTVVMADGDRRTIRLKAHWDQAEARRGTQVAQFLSGSDNESSYTGFAFVVGTRVALWKRHRSGSAVLQSALAYLLQSDSFAEAGMAYALESGNCWKCGRRLTVPASIHRGMGPVCAKGGTDPK